MQYRSILSGLVLVAALLIPAAAEETGKSTVFIEAEAFEPLGNWKTKPWGTNYYAATFANTFISRLRYLGAPEQCERSRALGSVEIPADGEYLALIRYEAVYNFQTEFSLVIEQDGKEVFKRGYGGMENPKLWAFRKKVQPQVRWYWGPVENIVWEGTDAKVKLKKGKADLILVADKQPEPAARRNIDVIMLTTDTAEVEKRIEKENYLPLDGLLTQAGDVFVKIKNPADAKSPIIVSSPKAREHSPYWVHIRNWERSIWIDKNGKADNTTGEWIKPGEASPWVEIGSMMDALNVSGYFPKVIYPKGVQGGSIDLEFEFGVPGENGPKSVKRTRYKDATSPTAQFAIPADLRYGGKIQTFEEILERLLADIKEFPVRGRIPKDILFFNTFRVGKTLNRISALQLDIAKALGNNVINSMPGKIHPAFVQRQKLSFKQTSKFDVRSIPTSKLADWVKELKKKGQFPYVKVISMGDEIHLSGPTAGESANNAFREFLKANGINTWDVLISKPEHKKMGPDALWQLVTYKTDTRETNPPLYYWAMRYRYQYGVDRLKERVDILEKELPEGVLIGANYSPHPHYRPNYFQWIDVFRQRAMTMPWSEDYLWQIPVTSQQVIGYMVSALRAGARKHGLPIYMYVMPHTPGNTPASFRRAFYSDVANGATLFDFFEPIPTAMCYTENSMLAESTEMYRAIYDVIRDAGLFEDMVVNGKLRQPQVALLMSGTTDIWHNTSVFNAERQHLFMALKHAHIPLDIISEDGILEGDLKDYKAVYIADTHLRADAGKKLREWAKGGGVVFATAAAGLLNEYNEANVWMQRLLGIVDQKVDMQISYIHGKDNLPRLKPIDLINYKTSRHALPGVVEVYGVKGTFTPRRSGLLKLTGFGKKVEVIGSYKDGTPALFRHKVGRGMAVTCATLPGTAYVKPALPDRPADRGSTDDAYTHFLPTKFSPQTRNFITRWAFDAGITRPVILSEPLVETSLFDSKAGLAIPLVNYKGSKISNLQVRVINPGTIRHVSSASLGDLKFQVRKAELIVEMPLDVADMLMLRRYPPK